MFTLDGRRALVTGGNSGIGFSIAMSLTRAGASTVIIGRNNKKNIDAANLLQKINPLCSAEKFDLSNVSKIQTFYRRLIKKYGLFDILINCAGATVRKRADMIGIDEWNNVININLTSAFILSSEWAKSLISNNRPGSCIMIISLMSEAARPTTSAYGASKAGLKQLVKSLAVDWAKFNIRVNGIGPGYIKTDFTEPLYKNRDFSRWVVSRTPLGRWGNPDDIGPAAVFLCCDDAKFITGQTLFIDGGWLASF